MNKRIISSIIAVSLSLGVLVGCSTDKKEVVQVAEKPLAIDYSASPEDILKNYTEDGMREFRSVFHEKESLDYALKNIGKEASDFKLNTIGGETLKLSDFKGKRVILDIVKTTCPVCREVAPTLQEFTKANPDTIVLAIFPKDTAEDIKSYYHELGLEVDNRAIAGLDNEGNTVMSDYSLTKVPTLVFIDETGKISFAIEGDFDKAMLEDFYARAFGEKKLYDMVKNEKVEIDKAGKETPVAEDSANK